MKQPVVINLPRRKRLLITDRREGATTLADQAFVTNLSATVHKADGSTESYDLGSGTITTAGVLYLAGDWVSGSGDIGNLKYMASGTDATASGTANTALGTAIGTTAETATLTLGTASGNATVTAVATISYTNTYAVTEWGLFSSGTLAGATMWDRKTFAALNVVNGDSIQFTYVLTCSSGG